MSNETNEKQQQSKTPAKDRVTTIQDQLTIRKDELAKALPKHLTPERLIRVAVTCIAKTPKLQDCTGASLVGAVMQAAELGLEPGGALGHAYLVPYKTNGTMVCQLIVGYRGLIDLARRSGEVSEIEAHVVYEFDKYDVAFGLERRLIHVPKIDGERGKPVFVYSIAKFRDGGQHVELMSVGEVEKIRARSKSKDDGPWVTDWSEMARKTVVRRAAKYWPVSSERLSQALEVDSEDFVDGQVVASAAVQQSRLTADVTSSKPTRTEEVKARVLPAKAATRKVETIDVQAGETDEEALARVAAQQEPPADVVLPGEDRHG